RSCPRCAGAAPRTVGKVRLPRLPFTQRARRVRFQPNGAPVQGLSTARLTRAVRRTTSCKTLNRGSGTSGYSRRGRPRNRVRRGAWSTPTMRKVFPPTASPAWLPAADQERSGARNRHAWSAGQASQSGEAGVLACAVDEEGVPADRETRVAARGRPGEERGEYPHRMVGGGAHEPLGLVLSSAGEPLLGPAARGRAGLDVPG